MTKLIEIIVIAMVVFNSTLDEAPESARNFPRALDPPLDARERSTVSWGKRPHYHCYCHHHWYHDFDNFCNCR